MLDNILIYGGSFDPPHFGHINTALAVQNHVQFERVIYLPCKSPVLKKPATTSCEQRIQMLKLALEAHPEFEIDLRETLHTTPSYMVNTLHSFRDEMGENMSITILLGMDAFLQLPQWHTWHKLLELSHLLVIKRAQIDEETMSEQLKTLLTKHEVFNATALLEQPHLWILR